VAAFQAAFVVLSGDGQTLARAHGRFPREQELQVTMVCACNARFWAS